MAAEQELYAAKHPEGTGDIRDLNVKPPQEPTNHSQAAQEELENKVLRIIQHKTLEEHAAMELVMSLIEAEASRRELAVLDELEKKKEVVRDNDRDDYLFYAVNVAELQAKRQSLKSGAQDNE